MKQPEDINERNRLADEATAALGQARADYNDALDAKNKAVRDLEQAYTRVQNARLAYGEAVQPELAGLRVARHIVNDEGKNQFITGIVKLSNLKERAIGPYLPGMGEWFVSTDNGSSYQFNDQWTRYHLPGEITASDKTDNRTHVIKLTDDDGNIIAEGMIIFNDCKGYTTAIEKGVLSRFMEKWTKQQRTDLT